jgi:phosphatidylglycerophosphate synthase
MLLYAALMWFFFRERRDFWCIKLRGILTGLILIPVLFYTYNGAVGKSPDWLNIAIFFISALIAYFYETRRLYKDEAPCKKGRAIAFLCVLALLFVLFTFKTPEIGLFRDPLTGTYGI